MVIKTKHYLQLQATVLDCMAKLKGVGRKVFKGGPVRIEPVLTTKNRRIFEIWAV